VLFVRDIPTSLAGLLSCESNFCLWMENARLLDYYHRTKFGQNEPVNKSCILMNCDLFGCCEEESLYVLERPHLLSKFSQKKYV
jgi:hypothetical protein